MFKIFLKKIVCIIFHLVCIAKAIIGATITLDELIIFVTPGLSSNQP